MTGSERDTLRGHIDAARRAVMADSKIAVDRRKVQPRLRPAADTAVGDGSHGHDIQATAPAASLAIVMAVELLGEEKPRRTFQQCIYCGWPAVGRACRRHRDLLAAERDLWDGVA